MRKALAGPNRSRASRERGRRCTRLREKLCCSMLFFFDWYKVSQSGRKLFQEKDGYFVFLPVFSVTYYIVFAVPLCRCAVPCCAFFFLLHTAYFISIKKKKNAPPGVCMYMRQPPVMRSICGFQAVSPEGWQRDSWHFEGACYQLQSK